MQINGSWQFKQLFRVFVLLSFFIHASDLASVIDLSPVSVRVGAVGHELINDDY